MQYIRKNKQFYLKLLTIVGGVSGIRTHGPRNEGTAVPVQLVMTTSISLPICLLYYTISYVENQYLF